MLGAQETYAAMLFDMDGVLVDTAASVVTFWRGLAAEYSLTITDGDLVAHVYGRTAEDTLRALFPALGAAGRRAIHARLAAYEDELSYRGVAGAVALLRALQAQALPAVLVTSGSLAKVQRVVMQLDLTGLLTAYVTSADISQGKPDPEPYLVGARKAGVTPGQCVAFEDAIGGIQSAVAAGTTCIGIGDAAMAPALIAAGARTVVPDLTHIRVQPDVVPEGTTRLIVTIGDQLRLRLARREERPVDRGDPHR